jgi:hypothetical protein
LRTKRLPPAPASAAHDRLRTARGALSHVPDPEADCCARVGEAMAVDRQTARDWLTLLRALGLVERSGGDYRRTEGEAEDATLRERFVSEVYGAREVVDALEGPDGAFRRASSVVDAVPQPTWERHRSAEPEAAWTRHVERLLDWLVALGAAERAETGYRLTASDGGGETA